MTNRRLEIGKGLKALISDIDKINIEEKRKKVQKLSLSIAQIDVTQIEINPYQPRSEFGEAALLELSDSIKIHGIIQPLTVRSIGHDNYQLISGERRLRASKIAGLQKVPAYIRIADDQGLLEMALIENIQRENLNVIEVATAYQRLIEECNLTHVELSERIGKNRTSVTNYLRILKLPPTIKDALRGNKISMGHARSIAGLDTLNDQLEAFHIVLSEKLSVRQTELLIKKYSKKNQNTKQSFTLPNEWKQIQDDLSTHLGARVQVKLNQKGQGQIQIIFSDTDHFNQILEIMGK